MEFGWFDRTMKPGFALSLSSEGIAFLRRAAGGWRNIGKVPLSHPDLPRALADLRTAGEALAEGGSTCCKVVIPNDQIRYLTVETGTADAPTRREMAKKALEGATPYAVADLSFDISEDGPLTHVAAVARETLEEAEGFALEHGFIPASFVAVPGDMDFLGEPFFGASTAIGDAPIEPDGIAVVDIGPVIPRAPKAAEKSAPQAKKIGEPAGKETEAPAEATPVLADEAAPAAGAPDESKEPAPETVEENPATKPGVPDQGADKDAVSVADTQAETPDDGKTEAQPLRPEDKTAGDKSPQIEISAKAGAEGAAEEDPGEDQGPAMGFSTRRRKADSGAAAPALAGATRAAPTPVADHKITAQKGGQGPQKTGAPEGPAAPVSKKQPDSASAAPATPITPPPGQPQSGKGESAVPGLLARLLGQKAGSGKPAPSRTPAKPRNMGLVLTVLLVVFMVTVAALAYVSPGGLFGRFSDQPAAEDPPLRGSTPEPAAEPEAPQPGDATPAETTVPEIPDEAPSVPLASAEPAETTPADLMTADTEDRPIAPQVSALPDQPDPGVTFLSDTEDTPGTADAQDQADIETARLDPEAIADGVLDDTETETEPEPLSAEDRALEQAAQYAATGIWQAVPEIAQVPAVVDLDGIYVASIDDTDLSQDAVALPAQPDASTDDAPDVVSSPAAAGSAIALDRRGLVEATPEGTVNPDGVMVFLGRPPVVPPPTPERIDPAVAEAAAAAEAEAARLEALSQLRPRARPADLTEQVERAQLGGRSRAELASLRPRIRPASLKTEEQESQPATALAVATSVTPRARPTNFSNIVDRAQRSTSAVATAAAVPATVTPRLPSSASVSRQATITNAINLRRLNLIGVYGTSADRRALVRLPSGRYRKVQVGDRLDGGRVVAIGDARLQYQKSGRNHTLEMPE
ncbi:hypothetical protein [Pseudophaeobacter sp. C1-32P7]|uniref:hypothetical protein n=1 Tax=Pseudophaeobacter sp. C1-32P7 TaxID=3098142 RepID=UPI0034D63179